MANLSKFQYLNVRFLEKKLIRSRKFKGLIDKNVSLFVSKKVFKKSFLISKIKRSDLATICPIFVSLHPSKSCQILIEVKCRSKSMQFTKCRIDSFSDCVEFSAPNIIKLTRTYSSSKVFFLGNTHAR